MRAAFLFFTRQNKHGEDTMHNWERLADRLKHEADLLSSRLDARALAQRFQDGWGNIVNDGTDIVACAFLWPTPDDKWHELGSIWTSPHRRGNNLGARVFRACSAIARNRKQNTFLITKHPRIEHLAMSEGWQRATRETWITVPWSASCGPCDRVLDKMRCPMRATLDCRMFFLAF